VLEYVYDIAVSIEVDGIHNIAVAGEADWDLPDPFPEDGTVYRLKAGTWLSASWEDTRGYLGWDNGVGASGSTAVITCDFSTNFDIDDTVICMSVSDDVGPDWGRPWLQSGIWEGGGGSWNAQAGFPNAVEISANGDTLYTGAAVRSMGFALPSDYDGSDPGARIINVYVDAFNTTTALVGGFVMRVDNGSVSEPYGPSGEPLLYSIDFHGDADTGKMMVGEYVKWDNDCIGAAPWGCPIEPGPCEGVRVWHTVELDPCCPDWELACKSPSGPMAAIVMYTPGGDKAYASTTGVTDEFDPGHPYNTLDESAFSVSLDDGVSFNQIGLIDTDIDHLSDVAICPDCGVIYLATVNEECDSSGCYECANEPFTVYGEFDCDSVWRSYDDGDTWERVFHGDWVETGTGLLLRLPCDAVEDCCDQDPVAPSGTIYLGIEDTDMMFYSRDCGQCWNEPPATKIEIQDFAVESENVVYVINHDGDFSMSTQYGRRWSDPVSTGLDSGHTIVSCCNEGFIVAGGWGEVAWSDDGGDSWNETDALPIAGDVHVACDPVCENTVYAAVGASSGNIFRTDITDGSWTNLNAMNTYYHGIVVATEGTLYASTCEIGVDSSKSICDRFVDPNPPTTADEWYSGVARNLTPCETACCGTEDWDYLICGLSDQEEDFCIEPTGLRICGCLTTDTNSILWAIDDDEYDVIDGCRKGGADSDISR
jgi:hypothetical protein